MLQPKFSLSQTSDTVCIRVNVPYIRVGDAEVAVDDNCVTFYCQPYFLKLMLPGSLVSEEQAKATYDADDEHGTLCVTIPKATPGEHFPDLDLPSRLLASPAVFPSRSTLDTEDTDVDNLPSLLSGLTLSQALPPAVPPASASQPLIQVLHSTSTEEDAAPDLLPAAAAHSTAHSCGYGFNRSHVGLFSTLRDEAANVVQLPQPDSVPAGHRARLRQAHEDVMFDADRYCGDYAGAEDDPVYQEAVAMCPWWCTLARQRAEGSAPPWQWQEEEQEAMAGVKTRELLIDGQIASAAAQSIPLSTSPIGPECARLLASLASMLFSYAYDHRSSGGEGSVESGWTLATLSAALAWLDDGLIEEPEQENEPLLRPLDSRSYLQQLLEACAVACVRRGITFPYLRRLDLCLLCLQDAAMLLSLGKRPVLRAILSMRRVFAHDTDDKSGAPRYLLNKLWMDELVLWLQAGGVAGCDDQLLGLAGAGLAAVLPTLTPTHAGLLSWNLPALHELVESGQGGGEVDEDSSGDGEEEEEEDP